MVYPITPKIIPGRLCKENRGAVAWSKQNLLAYGCRSFIVIVDPISLQILQTLDEHRATVVSVKWSLEELHSDLDSPYKLRLASGDKSGCILIWNVVDSNVLISLQDTNPKPVVDIQWVPKETNFLLALYSPASLILWNLSLGSKQWKIDLNDPIHWVEPNPFDSSHLALTSNTGSVYFLRDFHTQIIPSQVVLKYTVSSSSRNTTLSSTPNNKNLPTNNEFRQILFSPHTRNIMYFVLSKEIIVFDLSIHQTVGSISFDRTRSPFCQILICKEENSLLFCLHEDGSLSAWTKQPHDFIYDLICFSDTVRFNKIAKKKGFSIYSIVNAQLQETKIAGLSSDGSIWIWDFLPHIESSFVITGLVDNVSSPISTLQVSPFHIEGEALVAIGTQNGTLQIIDVASLVIIKEFLLWEHPVRGLIWVTSSQILVYSSEESGKGEYKNYVSLINIESGKQKDLRKNSVENSFIRGIKVSSAAQYFAIFFREKPFEIWDLRSCVLLKTMKFVQTTSFEWSPPVKSTNSSPFENILDPERGVKEYFIFTLSDGSVRNYSVENNIISATPDFHVELGSHYISSLAWKDEFLVGGDVSGNIHVWNFLNKKSFAFSTNKGIIKRIRFSPTAQHQILVLFNEGEFGIWDLDHNTRISISSYLKGRDLRAIDCDWISDSCPIVATNDDSLRILDKTLSISNSPLDVTNISKPIHSPHIIEHLQALQLKALLQHYIGANHFLFQTPTKSPSSPRSIRATGEEEISLDLVDPQFLNSLSKSTSLAEKCYLTAKYFGNEEEIIFWKLTLWAFNKFTQRFQPMKMNSLKEEEDSLTTQEKKNKLLKPDSQTGFPSTPTKNVRSTQAKILVDSSQKNPTWFGSILSKTNSAKGVNLPIYFDLLLDSSSIQTLELEKASVHEKKKTTYELTKKLTDFNILLGQKEKAIELLLETPPESPNFHHDSLKAAVIAASISPETFQNTLKMVATNHIVNGNIDEGVQFLCLIGKSFEACRYLQGYDRWTDAVWLAKISLPEDECSVILKHWAYYLHSTNQKLKSVYVLLTLGEFHQALQLLHELQRFDMAAHFAVACIEKGFLYKPGTQSPSFTSTPSSPPHSLSSSPSSPPKSMDSSQPSSPLSGLSNSIPLEKLIQSIYLEYGFYLHRLGNTTASEYYWHQAGTEGDNLIKSVRAKGGKRDKKSIFLRNTQ